MRTVIDWLMPNTAASARVVRFVRSPAATSRTRSGSASRHGRAVAVGWAAAIRVIGVASAAGVSPVSAISREYRRETGGMPG
ncbi:hypothetical protein [Dactylosporangium darangshiense]|uniref:hypothetical protein n=1 Tax=Dactylosporangium darangshiense TaxID=579108 RepID=UPI0031ED99A3